jgi:chromosome segregation ATPase
VSFTVENFRDLIKLLEEHPEWRAELRRLVLSEELLTVPDRLDRLTRAVESSEARLAAVEVALRELAAAQARTEAALARLVERVDRLEEGQTPLAARMDRLEEALVELAKRQAATEAALVRLVERVERLEEGQAALSARMDRVEAALAELAERQVRTEAALAELAERQARTEAVLARLTERVDQLTVSHSNLRREVDDLKGWTLELRYERRLPSILGHVLRRASVATPVAFLEEIEDRISEEAFEELRNADLLVRGRLKSDPQRSVWLVVEVSAAIDPNDVARASRRAALLRQAGELAIPVVAGARLTAEAEALLSVQPVVLVQDGSASGWERALAHWESPAAST